MDVAGIGLGNIDLVARVDETFLARHGIGKGLEVMMDDLAFGRLRAELDNFDAQPGGCVANTLCGLSAMGVDTSMFAKIGQDEFESLYRSGFYDYMVGYDVESASGHESSQCAVLITPDGERSFAYVRGASWALTEADIHWRNVMQSRYIHTEIYMIEFDDQKLADRAYDISRQQDIPLSMKIVDRFYAERYAAHIRARCDDGGINLIVGNYDNLPALVGADHYRNALRAFADWPAPVLMTAARDGVYLVEDGDIRHFETEPVASPKNSSGAGDQFMAGFIAGQLDHRSMDESIQLGMKTARAILNHNQPRPCLSFKQSIRF